MKKKLLMTCLFILFTGIFNVELVYADEQVEKREEVMLRTNIMGGGGSRPKNIIYVSGRDIERYYGKKITSGSDIADYAIPALLSNKYPSLLGTIGFSKFVVDKAVDRRRDQIDAIKRNILYNGARGMKVRIVNSNSYPYAQLSFETWW